MHIYEFSDELESDDESIESEQGIVENDHTLNHYNASELPFLDKIRYDKKYHNMSQTYWSV